MATQLRIMLLSEYVCTNITIIRVNPFLNVITVEILSNLLVLKVCKRFKRNVNTVNERTTLRPN